MSLFDDGHAPQDQTIWTAENARKAGFLAIPLKAIREHGQAAQTLAGLLAILRQDGSSTRRHQATLAKAAFVSERTLRRHLADLEAAGLIRRIRDRYGVTIHLVAKPADLFADGFLPLPRYATGRPWVERIVLAWVVYRAELSLSGGDCEDALKRIAKALGLSPRVVRRAVRDLEAAGLLSHAWHLPGHAGTLTLRPPEPAKKGEDKMAAGEGTKWPVGEDKMAASIKNSGIRTPLVKKGSDRKRVKVSVADLAPPAAELFDRCQYHGDQGQAIWKAAGLLVAGLVSEHAVRDAANAVRECKPADRPAYFWCVLKTHQPDANELIRRLSIRTWPGTPPRPPERDAWPRPVLKRA